MRRKIGALSFAVAFLVFASVAFAGQTLYVDADAAGANNGSSWADAYNFLQDALAVTEYGDEIWVAEGIYEPDQGSSQTPGDRAATFQLISGVALYGGFPPGGGSWQDRDPNNYETILSGDLSGDDADVADPTDLLDEPTRAENSYHVVTGSGTDAMAVLDGFTITAGRATASGCCVDDRGGGLFIYNGSPTIIRCKFVDNGAKNCAGAVWINHSLPTFVKCSFEKNIVSPGNSGAAIHNVSSSKLTLIDCVLLNNTLGESSTGGGAVFVGGEIKRLGYQASSVKAIRCVFIANNASAGGAVINNGFALFGNCLFAFNDSLGDGSGSFTGKGGAIANFGQLTIQNCTFYGNSAVYSGGGIYTGSDTSDTDLESVMNITNSILWGNIGNGEGEDTQIDVSDTELIINHCCIQAWTGALGGTGNIDDDPLFVDPGYWQDPCDTPDDPFDDIWVEGDYHLQAGSPCIDAGDNSVVEPNSTDLDGNPRIIDGDGDGEAIVDMGAYEFLPSIEADLRILPRVINRKSRGRYVLVIMRLPEGIAEEDIDTDEEFVLEPGNIESILWRTAVDDERVRVFVLFEKARLMDAVSSNGEIELTVSGQLKSGQGIYGVDTIRIIGPPGEHPRGHIRPRPQRRAGGRVR